jgi:tubulin polyglutamylase TTLL6/13
MLDHQLVPQLLEVNQSPSLTTDSPLDKKIKKALVTDTIRIWNLSLKRKYKAKNDKKAQMQKRLLNYQEKPLNGSSLQDVGAATGKIGSALKRAPPEAKLPAAKRQQMQEEREAERKRRMLQREDYEKDNCGQYELIYPLVSYQEEFDILAKTEGTAEKEKPTQEEAEADSSDDEKEAISKPATTPWDQQLKYLQYMEKAK